MQFNPLIAAILGMAGPVIPNYTLPEKEREPLPKELLEKLAAGKEKARLEAIEKARLKRERKALTKKTN